MDMDDAYYSALDLLKTLIKTPSLSRQETEAAAIIESYLSGQNEVSVSRKHNNVWATTAFDPQRPTILLNSHIDTVKPVAGWKNNPFEPVETDGKLYGLGSNDAGASLVCLLHTFLILSARPQPYNLIFLASAEEEVSGQNGIESVIPELPPINLAVVGEPTEMQPAIAEKGLVVLDGHVTGKSGHAARNEGENALYKAIDVINKLRNYRFDRKSDLLGEVKLTVTQIQSGTQHNVIPDRCDFVVDVRTNELYSNREIVETLVKSLDCVLQPRSLRLNSSHLPASHPFLKRAELLGRHPFGSPTLSDQALLPYPSVKMGPGDSARSHTADEHIYTSELREGIELYVKLLDGLNIR